jgi:hypothetical protein
MTPALYAFDSFWDRISSFWLLPASDRYPPAYSLPCSWICRHIPPHLADLLIWKSCIHPRPAWIVIFLISGSQVATIIGLSHHAQWLTLCFDDSLTLNFPNIFSHEIYFPAQLLSRHIKQLRNGCFCTEIRITTQTNKHAWIPFKFLGYNLGQRSKS